MMPIFGPIAPVPTEFTDLHAANRQLGNELRRAEIERDEALDALAEARELADFNGAALWEMWQLRQWVRDIADPPLRAWQLRSWKDTP
jgi:hypothetical protein